MRHWLPNIFLFSMAVAVLVPLGVARALDVPAAPPLDRPIIDQAGVLTQDQIDTLAQQINISRKQRDYQFGILIIKSLAGNAIEDYSLKVARSWGIGDKTKNNGVLLLIAIDDREVRIEVGRGLEGDLTDAESGRIICNTISPQFKKGDYYSGTSLGVQNIAAQVEGRPQADTSAQGAAQGTESSAIDIFTTIIFIGAGLFAWFVSILARSKSWWGGGVAGGAAGVIIMAITAWVWWSVGLAVLLMLAGLLLDWVVSRNYVSHVKHGGAPSWWAGGPWLGGGRGSGGGGFGGGGFGGGGASGSW